MEILIAIALYVLFVHVLSKKNLAKAERIQVDMKANAKQLGGPGKVDFKVESQGSIDMTPPAMQTASPLSAEPVFAKIDADFLQNLVVPVTAKAVKVGKKSRKAVNTVVEILATSFEAQWYSIPGIVTRKIGEPCAVRSTDPTRIKLATKLRKKAIADFRKMEDELHMERLESHLHFAGLI